MEVTPRIEMISGKWQKNLADVIDDGVASSLQFMNEFNFHSQCLMVCGRSVLGGAITDEMERFTKKGNSLPNNVTKWLLEEEEGWGKSLE